MLNNNTTFILFVKFLIITFKLIQFFVLLCYFYIYGRSLYAIKTIVHVKYFYGGYFYRLRYPVVANSARTRYKIRPVTVNLNLF